MADLRAAAKQALDILDSEFTTVDGEFCRWCDGRLGAKHGCKLEQTITALRAALAQQAKAEAERDALQSRADRAEQCAEYEAKRADKAEAERDALRAERDALLEAMKELVARSDADDWNGISTMKARAAIAKAEGA